MPPRYQSTLLSFEEKLRNLADLAGQPGHRGHARIGAGLNRGGLGQSLIQLPDAAETRAAAAGQLLVLSATADSIASGGDYVTFDTEVYRHGFDDAYVAGESFVWPITAVGSIQVEFEWATYTGGGRIEIEVDGAVPAWGMIADGTVGRRVVKRRGVHIQAGSRVAIKVTHSDGSTQVADVYVEFEVEDPAARSRESYRAVVLDDGPVAYWRLGDAGPTAADETGNGHTATFAGSPTLGTDGAIAFDTDTAVTFGAGASADGSNWSTLEFTGTQPFTVEAWMKADAATPRNFVAVHQQDFTANAGPNQGWLLGLIGDGSNLRAAFERWTGANSDSQLAWGPYDIAPDGSWVHVVGVYDGAGSTVYVNGDAVGSDSSPNNALSATTTAAQIGARSATPGEHAGPLDEVAIYDRALSAAEILHHYLVGAGEQ